MSQSNGAVVVGAKETGEERATSMVTLLRGVHVHSCYGFISHAFVEPQSLRGGLQDAPLEPIFLAGSSQNAPHDGFAETLVAIFGQRRHIVNAGDIGRGYNRRGSHRYTGMISNV